MSLSEKWSRRAVLRAGGATALTATMAPVSATAIGPRPSALYILLDQARAVALSAYGNTNISTPNIDALAADGCLFQNAYNSQALCTPARSTLLSGLMPNRVGLDTDNNLMLPDVPCIAQPFKDDGYFCGYIGKWHLDDQRVYHYYIEPGWRRRGFDDYWASHRANHLYQEAHVFTNSGQMVHPNPADLYQPVWITDLTIDAINQAGNDPFFIMVSYAPPHPAPDHVEWEDHIPTEWRDLVDSATLTLRPNVGNGVIDPDPTRPGQSRLGAREYMKMYYASLLSLDEEVGRLVSHLKALGRYDHTLIVFTSDHGELGGSHALFGKTACYQEANRVPLIISWPNFIPGGAEFDFPVMAADIMPTVHGLANLTFNSEQHGRDLSPILRGLPQPHPKTAFVQGRMLKTNGGGPATYQQYWMICTKNWSYTEAPPGEALFNDGASTTLYHLSTDPYEQLNVSDNPNHADMIAAFSNHILQWRTYVGEFEPPITDGLDLDTGTP